jgi:rhodanese-related sulfurtransferase
MLKQPKTKVLDVRSPMEFMSGHVEGAINIPLNEIPYKLEEIKSWKSTVVACCAAGSRSAQAVMYLRQEGLQDVHNGGGWMEVQMEKFS